MAAAAAALRPLRHPTLFLAALLLIGCLGLLSGGGGPSRAFPAGQWESAAVENSSSTFLSSSRPQLSDGRETCWCDAQFRSLLADPGLRNTTCGLAAFARGPGQKVVGFTYYEEVAGGGGMEAERGYFRGIVENLQLIRYVRAYIIHVFIVPFLFLGIRNGFFSKSVPGSNPLPLVQYILETIQSNDHRVLTPSLSEQQRRRGR